jgi:hypothetical protein
MSMKYTSIICSVIVAFGFSGLGYFASKNVKSSTHLIEVKGLAEKVIKSDVADIVITVSNSNSNLEELYKKRTADKEKIMEFLTKSGVIPEEIADISMETSEGEEEEKSTLSDLITVKKHVCFRSKDTFSVRTSDFEKIDKIKSDIIKLSSEGVLVTYTYSYQLTNFCDVKIQMMREASENAQKNAEAFIEPHHQRIGKVVYLKQGEISIRAENETEETDRWASKEKTSVYKKLRLVVRAGFEKRR